MKEIKIVLSGEKEEQIAQHIMKSVYEAINEHGYCDINLCADTIPEPRKDIQIPTFLTQYARGGVIENGRIVWQEIHHSQVSRGCGGLPRVRS